MSFSGGVTDNFLGGVLELHICNAWKNVRTVNHVKSPLVFKNIVKYLDHERL